MVVRDAWSDAGEATAGKWKERRLAGQPGPDLGPCAEFVIHPKCEGKPLKDFVEENDMIKFMSSENHSSSYVEKTA